METHERIGRIIHHDIQKSVAFILEEGGGNVIHRFSLEAVEGTLRRANAPYIADLTVKFAIGEDGAVASVSKLAFRALSHEGCHTEALITAAKQCECGNETFLSYCACEVCAMTQGRCVRCGESMVPKSPAPGAAPEEVKTG